MDRHILTRYLYKKAKQKAEYKQYPMAKVISALEILLLSNME